MESLNVADLILLTTNILIAPGLVYMGIWGYRDQKDFSKFDRARERRARSRRWSDQYSRQRDRRRLHQPVTANQREQERRNARAHRRRDDRVAALQLGNAESSA